MPASQVKNGRSTSCREAESRWQRYPALLTGNGEERAFYREKSCRQEGMHCMAGAEKPDAGLHFDLTDPG